MREKLHRYKSKNQKRRGLSHNPKPSNRVENFAGILILCFFPLLESRSTIHYLFPSTVITCFPSWVFFYIFYFYFTKITNRPFVLIHFCVNKTQQARFLNVCEKFQTFYVVRCYLQVASFLFYVAHWCIPKHRYS